MQLDIYNTHMELYPYKQFDQLWLEKIYTATDKYQNSDYACGYIIHDGKLYLPKGSPASKIQYTTNCNITKIMESDPIEYMSRHHSSYYEPRDKLQMDSIEFLKGEGHQLGLNLATGKGKENPVSMYIPTPSGWKRFGSLSVGDEVYSIDWKPTKIVKIFPQGVKDIYRITLVDDRYIDCGLEHLSLMQYTPDEDLGLSITVNTTEFIIECIDKGRRVWLPAHRDWVKYPESYQHILDGELHQEYVEVKSVELNRQEEAMCIAVDNRSRLYVVDQMIITHNTFCVAYASTELNQRTLIVTPNTGLKNQWIKTYKTMFDYKSNELIDIAGSPVMEAMLDGDVRPADVYFVNHQTLRSFIASHGPYKLKEFFQKLGAGIKVYDESHMEFANILLIDFLSNTDRTWYLTATFDRSDKSESRCFQQAFSSVDTFGKMESQAVTRKHVIYHIVNINSKISPKNRAKLYSYPGFGSPKYGRYSIFEDEHDTAYKTILEILNKTTNMEGKTMIFLPIIEGVDEVVKRLKRDYPIKSVAAYHSKIDKEEKESAEKKDIIVTTIKSCGTGRDIKGLRSVICLEPIASKVVAEQMIGRLRPYADDKDTYFWDVVDRSIPVLTYWHRARFKTIQGLAKQCIEINDILG